MLDIIYNEDKKSAFLKITPIQAIDNANFSNLIFVVDVSGSMSSYLGDIKEGILSILKNISDQSYISVIIFDDVSKILCNELKICDNVETITSIISNIQLGGGTDILTGISDISTIMDATHFVKDIETKVILITDGFDNNNNCSEYNDRVEQLLNNMKKYKNLTMHCFGYGMHHDTKLLANFAREFDGRYQSIGDLDDNKISELLNGVLNNSLSDVKIHFKNINNITTNEIYKNNLLIDDNQSCIKFKNMYYGLNKAIHLNFYEEYNNIDIEFTYNDINGNTKIMNTYIVNDHINKESYDNLVLRDKVIEILFGKYDSNKYNTSKDCTILLQLAIEIYNKQHIDDIFKHGYEVIASIIVCFIMSLTNEEYLSFSNVINDNKYECLEFIKLIKENGQDNSSYIYKQYLYYTNSMINYTSIMSLMSKSAGIAYTN